MATYSTPSSLRSALGVTSGVLDDAAAGALLEDAEDIVDRLVGEGGYVDVTTGRKITPARLATWRRTKLERATNALAAVLHGDPTAFQSKPNPGIKGPDFEVAGSVVPQQAPAAVDALKAAAAILDAAGLRRLSVRTRP